MTFFPTWKDSYAIISAEDNYRSPRYDDQIMKMENMLSLVGIVAAILIVGSFFILTDSLPEHKAKDFNPLTNMSIKSNLRILKTPSPEDKTLMYAVSEDAEKALNIALKDESVMQITDSSHGTDLTIAAVQPTSLVRTDGEVIQSLLGQIRIASNWQLIDGKLYSESEDFRNLQGKVGESHQKLWTIIVDMDKEKVMSILEEPERISKEPIQSNITLMTVNMFLPDKVNADLGSTVIWRNISHIPHNVVGTYKMSSGSKIMVDSGPLGYKDRWQYTFEEEGVLEYHCTYHSDEGMKGTIIINKQS